MFAYNRIDTDTLKYTTFHIHYNMDITWFLLYLTGANAKQTTLY